MSRRVLGVLGLAVLLSACRATRAAPPGPDASSPLARPELEQRRSHLRALRAALSQCSLEQREAYEPSVEEEYSLGRTVAAQELASLNVAPLPVDHPLSLYVDRVGQHVALVADAQGEQATEADRADQPERQLEDRPWPLAGYRFLVLPLQEPRATASPGGTVMISTGMLERLQGEDELAAVLAHELSHLRRGHGVEVLKAFMCQHDAREDVAELATNHRLGRRREPPGWRNSASRKLRHERMNRVLQRRGHRLRALRNPRVLSRLLDHGTGGALLALRKGYLEEFELEADRMAIGHLAAAGYDPKALARLLQRMQGEAHGRDAYFRLHPSFEERLDTVAPRLDELPPEQRAPSPEAIAARTRRFQAALSSLPPTPEARPEHD